MWWWPNILYIFLPNCWSRQGTIWERSNRSRCQWLTHDTDYRALASFLVTGGNREYRRHEACAGVWGYRPQENFQIWRLWNVIFSTCHEICLRKIVLEYENGKQLQVTITKITESKENKFISTDLMCLAQQVRGEGSCPPLAPSLMNNCGFNFQNLSIKKVQTNGSNNNVLAGVPFHHVGTRLYSPALPLPCRMPAMHALADAVKWTTRERIFLFPV